MTIYWLTGVIGAGKSTLGAALTASMAETDFIDGDFCLVQDDALPFEERIKNKKDYLINKVVEYARNGKNLVIAFPVAKETVELLRHALHEYNAQLVVIAIINPMQDNATRAFSEWEQKRQQEMTDIRGDDYADIVFTHPTRYLHDSLKHLQNLLI